MSYLLRLVVPDRPGALGAVATALGTAGIDIVSLDVLERAAHAEVLLLSRVRAVLAGS